MNTPVSFEIAKLLKEKGFGISEKYQNYYVENNYYNESGDLIECEEQSGSLSLFEDKYSAPTIAEVVMWLYEKHRLDVIVRYPDSDTNKIEGINSVYYDIEIYWLSGGDAWKKYKRIGVSDDKTEAYEAAIEYVLKNLIQEEEQEATIVNLQDKERERIYEKILNRKME